MWDNSGNENESYGDSMLPNLENISCSAVSMGKKVERPLCSSRAAATLGEDFDESAGGARTALSFVGNESTAIAAKLSF